MKRVLFLCDRPLGSCCLEYLLREDCLICGVVSRDGREINWWGRSTVKHLCREQMIPWFDLSRPLIEVVEECQPDMIISVLYPKIVAKDIIEKIPCFNLHCAPLPEYAGWNSTLWAILNGEESFGATLHEMSTNADEGNIIYKGSFPIPRQVTNIELYQLAHQDGYKIFCENISRIISVKYTSTPQKGTRRYYRRTDLPSREVSLDWDSEKIATYARAFYFPPFEPAYVTIEGQKIWLIPKKCSVVKEVYLERVRTLYEEGALCERAGKG